MAFITSLAGLSKAKQICRVAKTKRKLIMGDKLVTQAMTSMDPPVTLLIVAADGGCADLVARATEHGLLIIRLPTRLEVGYIVGYPAVSSCVLCFAGAEGLLAELLQLG